MCVTTCMCIWRPRLLWKKCCEHRCRDLLRGRRSRFLPLGTTSRESELELCTASRPARPPPWFAHQAVEGSSFLYSRRPKYWLARRHLRPWHSGAARRGAVVLRVLPKTKSEERRETLWEVFRKSRSFFCLKESVVSKPLNQHEKKYNNNNNNRVISASFPV